MFLKTDDIALKSNTAGYIQHLCFNDEALKIKIRYVSLKPMTHLLPKLGLSGHKS